MTRLKSRIILFAVLSTILFGISGFSQDLLSSYLKQSEANFLTTSWSTTEGLPQNSINHLALRKDGSLLISTYGGLSSFNGLEFKQLGGQELLNIRATCSYEDSKGCIWIGSEFDGVYRFFPKNDSIAHYGLNEGVHTEGISAIFEFNNTIHIGVLNQGIFKFNSTGFVPVANNRFKNNGVFESKTLGKNSILVTTQKGIYLWSENDLSELYDNSTEGLGEPLSASLTTNNHLVFTTKWNIYSLNLTCRKAKALAKDSVYSGSKKTLLASKNEVWVGTSNYKIIKHNSSTGITESMPLNNNGKHVVSMLKDKHGSVWMGTNGSGLIRLNQRLVHSFNRKNGLNSNGITSVYTSKNQGIWVATYDNGINQILGKTINYFSENKGLSNNSIWCVSEDRYGNIYAGTIGDGLFVKPVDRTEFEAVSFFKTEVVKCLYYHQKSQTLCVGSDGEGALLLGEDTVRLFTEPNHPGNNIRAIAFDDKGIGYFGTRTGEVYKRFKSGEITEIKTPKAVNSNHIRSIHVDENNLVWIGTYSSGLWLVKEDSVFQIDKNLGLFDNQVSTIIEDENHRFWMSCNLGIYMVPKTNLLRLTKGEIKNIGCLTFSQTDGMGSSETNGGFYPAGAINTNGEVFIPTINGLSIVNTKSIDFASDNSEVKIELVLADGVKILPKNGTYILPKGTQNVEIHYDSPNLLYPEKINFQYQLKPLQKQVQFVGKRKVAYLQNLKPGPHTFELKASNQLGEFIGESHKILLYREYYFFETKSFKALIILVIFTLIFGSFWGYIKIQKRRQHQLEGLVNERTKELELEKQATEKALNTIEQQAKNLKQLNDNKSKFFAIVSHDIKNLITSFDGMGEIARHYVETKKFDRFNRITDMLDVSSSRLTLFLDNVLRWSIGELDRTPYNPEPVKIVDQIELIEALVSPMLDQKELKLNILVGDCVALADPHAVALILRNLVNNAIKFSPEKGRIWFECETQNDEVIIGVKNQGKGLSAARIKELENAKNSHSELGTFGEEGTGLGLHLVHVFLELNKGRLKIESEQGVYTKFKIYLPAKTD